ncbi:hypothetical protein ILUMI_21410 [Ignelater luminosus]|uniref:Adenosine deaminase domain-containing protein n=1 Tax=Ignelater luminosus TaxID=2038154 RepID=A0A8K0CC71_IGNLU|nr:hypothetical protein ILUMI_21410 [Ignelater luminosus]
MDLFELCKKVPKVELHAHLNGSLSEKTLTTLDVPQHLLEGYQIINNLAVTTPEKLNECFKLFKIAHDATASVNSIYVATKHVIEEFYKDNVIYLELRTTPRQESNMTKEEYIAAVVRAIEESKDFITVKLILSIDRRHSMEVSKNALNIILEMHEMYPDIIKGIDLCGDPSQGTFHENLFIEARNSGLKITLHCGEIKNDQEVLQMLKFKPDRIGHGTCIHPNYEGSDELWKLYKSSSIPTECCLTSNVLCGTTSTYSKHHTREWLQDELPFCINTDDKGVFNTSASEELLHAIENLNLPKTFLIDHSLSAIEYAFASEKEKMKIKEFLMDWKKQNQGLFNETVSK